MRLLLDKGFPREGRPQIRPRWRVIIPLEIELRWSNNIWHPAIPAAAASSGDPASAIGWWKPKKLQNSRGLRTNSSNPTKFVRYTNGKSLPRLFGGVATEGW
jgi:hypothetical protein